MTFNVIFDADDTLWETEGLYEEAFDTFATIMARENLGSTGRCKAFAKEEDRKNIEKYGFSKNRFPDSLLNAYHNFLKEKGEKAKRGVEEEIRKVGQGVFERTSPLIDGVRTTLQNLIENDCRLFLWTQGDKNVQETRLVDSGLRDLFDDYDVCDRKSVAELNSLLKKWGLKKHETWVVGDSIKSDINPALQLKVRAIWIPSAIRNREEAEPDKDFLSERLYLVSSIRDVPEVILRVDNEENIKAQVNDDASMVYLFISAYHELYYQYIMQVLAYPAGFVLRFPYDTSKWLPSPYR
jgi:putative hydrolase of the HAD superfamily